MKTAIVVGSGAGGATVAKELQGTYQVIVLEEGRPFRRATTDWTAIEKLRRTHLLVDERLLRVAMPAIRIRKTRDMVLVNAAATGGTTTIATGNGMRLDQGLRSIGIDLDAEFAEIATEVPSRQDTKPSGARQPVAFSTS